jgi:hypothetical protein
MGRVTMTESDWNTATDPQPMLEYLRGKATDRKLRLFACACCRSMWDLLDDPRSRKAVEIAEQFVDGNATPTELTVAWLDAEHAARVTREDARADIASLPEWDVWDDDWLATESDAIGAAEHAADAATDDAWEAAWGLRQCYTDVPRLALLNDILGPLPFRPVAVAPSWLTATVTALATAIYEERAFDRLPILADALEDAGCNNQEVLGHLRGGGDHCRGCWPVDLILGKE